MDVVEMMSWSSVVSQDKRRRKLDFDTSDE